MRGSGVDCAGWRNKKSYYETVITRLSHGVGEDPASIDCGY